MTLAFDAGKVVSNFFTYDATGKRSTRGTSINFVTPPGAKAIPAVVDGLPAGIRKVALPSYFSDEQEDSTALRYSITGNSNVDLFDAVTIDADKNLVLDFKSLQTATALIELQAMDSFGLVRTQSLYVKADGNPISAAPAGITATISMNENTSYAFLPTDFRFIDPDVPGHQLRNVKITTLPDRGRLTLTTATGITAVTAGQFIPAAAITARQLKYRPLANEHGTSYSSFTFQVQDSGGTVLGGADLDLSPNTITFNVVHNSGSTLMALLQDLDSQLVDQFDNGLAGSPKNGQPQAENSCSSGKMKSVPGGFEMWLTTSRRQMSETANTQEGFFCAESANHHPPEICSVGIWIAPQLQHACQPPRCA